VAGDEDPRGALQGQREAALARIGALQREFADIIAATAAANSDDEHDPEGATIAFERQHVAALLTQAREHLGQIDTALRRLDDGSYGRCVRCGTAIPAERLAARPTAVSCVGCAARDGR
jgi:DnaK suppressor protein